MTSAAGEVRAASAGERPATSFQRLLASRADAAAMWIERSISACGGEGSAAYYSRCYHPWRGWGPAYPETTGYIIPSLLRYAAWRGRAPCADLAVHQAHWIRSLQGAEGWLPAAFAKPVKPSIFNTGQMIFGLVAAWDHAKDPVHLDSALRAARWLGSQVDPRAGLWLAHSYRPGFSPAYYTRVCWPVLEVWSRTGEDGLRQAALRVLETIVGWQRPNGAVEHWSFSPDRPAFTHTIAYTIRGLLESGALLGADGEPFAQAARRAADALMRSMELRGRLAGAYDTDLRGRYWFTCLTGNCQLAGIWMRLYEMLRDGRYLNVAMKALGFVIRRQVMRSLDPNLRGAIPGSSPLWGAYLFLRYPNWAAKFFLDACMKAHQVLGGLLESGPCA